MPNKYRKEGASRGRVGYMRADKPSFDLDREAGIAKRLPNMKKVPASAATRETPLPKPVYAGRPMAPKATNVAPHSTKGIKRKFAESVDEEY